jgi:Asp-tRNA(Asn)/Glu-tRNA(Gln) amidotransferase A subunit family amidase
MKPTFNAISLEGTKTVSLIYDTLGFFARCLEDLRLVADVFAIEDDELASDVPLEEASVAVIKTPMWAQAGPGTQAFQARSVKVEEIPLPLEAEIGGSEGLERMQKSVVNREARVSLLREYRVGKTKLALAPSIRHIVENSGNVTHKEHIDAQDRLASLRSVIDKLAAKYDAIVTPSAVDEAPLGLGDMGSPVFNTLWTVGGEILGACGCGWIANAVQGFHTPVIHIPAFTGANGMPVGISLVTGRYRDQHLLRISKVLSEALMDGGGWKAKI